MTDSGLDAGGAPTSTLTDADCVEPSAPVECGVSPEVVDEIVAALGLPTSSKVPLDLCSDDALYDKFIELMLPVFIHAAENMSIECCETEEGRIPSSSLPLLRCLTWPSAQNIVKDVFAELTFAKQQQTMMQLVQRVKVFKNQHLEATSCAKCGKASKELKPCDACQLVLYCSRGCKKDHYKQHKKQCTELITAMNTQSHDLPNEVLSAYEELALHGTCIKDAQYKWDHPEAHAAILKFKRVTRGMDEWRKDALFVNATGFKLRHIKRSRADPDAWIPEEKKREAMEQLHRKMHQHQLQTKSIDTEAFFDELRRNDDVLAGLSTSLRQHIVRGS